MAVGVVKTGKNCLAAEVHLARSPSRQRQHFVVGADRKEAAIADGDRLCPRLLVVHCPDATVVQDRVRLGAREREHRRDRECSQGSKEVATCSCHEIEATSYMTLRSTTSAFFESVPAAAPDLPARRKRSRMPTIGRPPREEYLG